MLNKLGTWLAVKGNQRNVVVYSLLFLLVAGSLANNEFSAGILAVLGGIFGTVYGVHLMTSPNEFTVTLTPAIKGIHRNIVIYVLLIDIIYIAINSGTYGVEILGVIGGVFTAVWTAHTITRPSQP